MQNCTNHGITGEKLLNIPLEEEEKEEGQLTEEEKKEQAIQLIIGPSEVFKSTLDNVFTEKARVSQGIS